MAEDIFVKYVEIPIYVCVFNFSQSETCLWVMLLCGWIRVMVFNATFNNISVLSCWSVLLVEETEVSGENHRPVASH